MSEIPKVKCKYYLKSNGILALGLSVLELQTTHIVR